MLGGAYSQVPSIKKAKEMGHYVIICDYLEDNPGKKYADEYFNVSTTDKQAVVSLAASLNIDGVLCYASDPAAPTAAYVAEKLNLPSHPYESVEILSNKDLFREFQRKNQFNVPRAVGYGSFEEAKADFTNFKLPVMVKPVDSSGSKGITMIDSLEMLEESVKYALSFSRVKRVIVEEYIEKLGFHVGGDGFSVNGKLVFRSFANEYFPSLDSSSSQFVPIGASWPNLMPEQIQNKIHHEIQRVLDLLNMKTGAFNFDIRIDENENVYIIEIGARNGGDWFPQVIEYATGIDMIEYSIKAALGEDCNDLTMVETSGYWGNYLLHSQKSGVLKEVKIEKELEKDVYECNLINQPGDMISTLTGAHEKVGIMILKFASKEDMLDKMNRLSDLVEIIVDEPTVA